MEANISKLINLNGSNYQVCEGKMKNILYVKNYYLLVYETKKLDNNSDEEWNLFHQVCGYIR